MPLPRELCRAGLSHRWGRQTPVAAGGATSRTVEAGLQTREPRCILSRPSTSLSTSTHRPDGRDEWQLPRLSINKNHLPTGPHSHSQPRRSLQVLRDRAGNFHRSSHSHNHDYDDDDDYSRRPLSRQQTRSKTPSSPSPDLSPNPVRDGPCIPTLPSPRTLSTLPTPTLHSSLTSTLTTLTTLTQSLETARGTVQSYAATLNAVQASHLALLTRSDPDPEAGRELVRLRDQRDALIGIQEGNLAVVRGLEEGLQEGRGVVSGLRGELGRRGQLVPREDGGYARFDDDGDREREREGGRGRDGHRVTGSTGSSDRSSIPLRTTSRNNPARKSVLKQSSRKKFDVLGFPASEPERSIVERREVLHTFLR